jgi:hypothetical protein
MSRVRINFRLTRDGAYPPADTETMWAVPLGGDRFRIDNIPFFFCGVSSCDVVSARLGDNGTLWYEGIAEIGGHSTIRAVLYGDSPDSRDMEERVRELRSKLSSLGCSSELSHIPSLVSIDIPPDVPLGPVTDLLKKGTEKGLWDYEEATLAHRP